MNPLPCSLNTVLTDWTLRFKAPQTWHWTGWIQSAFQGQVKVIVGFKKQRTRVVFQPQTPGLEGHVTVPVLGHHDRNLNCHSHIVSFLIRHAGILLIRATDPSVSPEPSVQAAVGSPQGSTSGPGATFGRGVSFIWAQLSIHNHC